MSQLCLLDIPPKPTKKYIKSLLKSEDLVCRQDQVEICQTGWLDASRDTDKMRRKHVLRMKNSVGLQRWNAYAVDVYCLGYVTYVHAYTKAMQHSNEAPGCDGIRESLKRLEAM